MARPRAVARVVVRGTPRRTPIEPGGNLLFFNRLQLLIYSSFNNKLSWSGTQVAMQTGRSVVHGE